MASFRDDLLDVVEDIRSIPGELGLRQFQVWVRTAEWAGSRVGDGAETITDVRLLVGGQDPKVRQVQSKDMVAGLGELNALQFDIGPLTPGYTNLDVIDPPRTSRPSTTQYLVMGPGLPSEGLLCTRVKDNTDMSFRYMVSVRGSGRRKPAP
jgi:hypothetical protein